MRAALALFMLVATPAAANPELLAFMGGQGCTFGADSRDAALAAGFQGTELDLLIKEALDNGSAKPEGKYVVLSPALCTIRPPEIEPGQTLTSQEILAHISEIDAFASEGQPGCFLTDLQDHFDRQRGGARGSGFFDYSDFVAAGLISGELTYYAESPLVVPMGPQSVSGDCAKVPQIEGIQRSHALMIQTFDPIVRAWGQSLSCDDGIDYPRLYQARLILLQGGDWRSNDAQDGVNAWMWMSVMFISIAAGWHEGMTATDKGMPRPPICHYD
jgi:hypothetical protein